MKRLFADTAFWLALLMARDQDHERAGRWRSFIRASGIAIVPTELVPWERSNSCTRPAWRSSAAAICRDCEKEGVVIYASRELLDAAFDLYEDRDDKAWSLTDCLSFRVMDELRLKDALTADHHFLQAGFRALLLEEPPAD